MVDMPSPQRTDVSVGDYALVIYDEGEALYQYERPVDWEDLRWILKQNFEHNEVPPLNLEEASLYREHNGSSLATVTVYAAELSSSGDSHTDDEDNRSGYWTKINGEKHIPEDGAHYQQRENMKAVVNCLIEEYNILNTIELPYTPDWADNCSVNDVPEHPDGSEMRSPAELVSGDYLHTALNKQQKKYRIKNLASQVGANTTFHGEWED